MRNRISRVLSAVLALILVLLTVVGCSDGTPQTTYSPSDSDTLKLADSPKLNAHQQEALYEELFTLGSYVGISVDISQEEMEKLQSDYEYYSSNGQRSNIYRIATSVTITVNDRSFVFTEVGIRIKGNTSRDDFYSSVYGMYNLQHFRLSFNETFDDERYYGEDAKVWKSDIARQERLDRTFAGMNKLELKWNNSYDSTYVREIYQADMFRDFGTLAQRINLCDFDIFGKDCGVLKMYEPVDDIFLERRLNKQQIDGDLYKCRWGIVRFGRNWAGAQYTSDSSYGIDDPDSHNVFQYNLKTNRTTPDHSSFKNLIKGLNVDNLSKAELDSLVDMDYFVRFAAVSYFAGNPDDMRNNYNNHYLYFLEDSGKAIFITYDNDHGYGNGWNPDGNCMLDVSPYSTLAAGNENPEQVNPIYLNSVCSGGYYVQEYRNLIEEIANSKWMTFEHFFTYYNKALSAFKIHAVPESQFDNVEEEWLAFNIYGGSMPMSDYLEAKKQKTLDMLDSY